MLYTAWCHNHPQPGADQRTCMHAHSTCAAMLLAVIRQVKLVSDALQEAFPWQIPSQRVAPSIGTDPKQSSNTHTLTPAACKSMKRMASCLNDLADKQALPIGKLSKGSKAGLQQLYYLSSCEVRLANVEICCCIQQSVCSTCIQPHEPPAPHEKSFRCLHATIMHFASFIPWHTLNQIWCYTICPAATDLALLWKQELLCLTVLMTALTESGTSETKATALHTQTTGTFQQGFIAASLVAVVLMALVGMLSLPWPGSVDNVS